MTQREIQRSCHLAVAAAVIEPSVSAGLGLAPAAAAPAGIASGHYGERDC